MFRKYINLLIVTGVLLLLQVTILNHMRLFSYFMPLLYGYYFLKMPFACEQWKLLLCAVMVGFFMDTLMNTAGLNIAALSAMVYLRKPLLRSLVKYEVWEDAEEDAPVSMNIMSPMSYFLYLLISVTLHISILMLLEAFSVSIYQDLLPYILGSITITLPIFYIFDLLSLKR